MPHKKETLQRIVDLLEKDYPQSVFEYRLDTKRFMGTRIVPDVQVFAPCDSQKPVCVVEVGYTRPEKLYHYKQSGIQDIRWFGRDDGKLYSEGDVKPITHVVEVKYKFKPNPKDVWRSIMLDGNFECDAATDALYELRESVKKIPSRFGKIRTILRGLHKVDLQNHQSSWTSDWDVIDYMIGDSRGSADRLEGDLCENVFCTLWTNGRSAIVTRYCDICGDYRIDDGRSVPDAWFSIEDTVATYESFMYEFRKQVKGLVTNWRVEPDKARSEHEKTIEELLTHLEESGLDVSPATLDAAEEWGENLPWRRAATKAA